jgi:hypothetical protein
MGCQDLTIVVDHAPLVKLLDDRWLHDISNPRLLRLKEKTLLYILHNAIKHLHGVNNKGPDALSRKPVSLIPDNNTTIEETAVSSVISQLTHSDLFNASLAVIWEWVEEATQNDNDLVSSARHSSTPSTWSCRACPSPSSPSLTSTCPQTPARRFHCLSHCSYHSAFSRRVSVTAAPHATPTCAHTHR